MQSISIDRTVDEAFGLQQAGQLQEAERLYRSVLTIEPRHPEANHNLGVMLLGSNRIDDALPYLKRSVEADPASGQTWVSYIDALIQAGRYESAGQVLALGKGRGLAGAAIESLERRLALVAPRPAPSFRTAQAAPVTVNVQGAQQPLPQTERNAVDAMLRSGRIDEAASRVKVLRARHGEDPWVWRQLGRILRLQGKNDEAVRALSTATRLAPADAVSHFELGLALDRCGLPLDAEASLRRALQLDQSFADAYNELGMLLERTLREPEAEASYRRALELRPDWAGVHSNLGVAQKYQGKFFEAEASFRRAIELAPEYAGAHVNLAAILKDTQRFAEAEACLRRALQIDPAMAAARSELLFIMNYVADHAPEFCLAEARAFGRMVRESVAAPFSAWKCKREPDRLRVGVVSGDLHMHPVGYFLESVLQNVDPTRVELIGYPSNPRTDDLTTRLSGCFAAWTPLYGRPDDSAARLVHDDGVHVLLDLSGHTVNNRLGVFAWKPAPVQATWLGYFATTGVAEIDYLLADETSVPKSDRNHFSEEIWYLPATRLCFTPPQASPSVSPLPALHNGFVTFGSFQGLAKINDRTLRFWSQVLAGVPQARLRLQNPQLADLRLRAQFAQRLAAAGIDPGRVDMFGPKPRDEYLADHAQVDLILDTFPFPGGTTTCEALWMGVPTLTLAGDRLLSRQGASLLHAAGLNDWIAGDATQFVDKALAFACDLPSLAALRSQMRSRLAGSPLFDAKRFASDLVDALWGMWRARDGNGAPASRK